MYTSIHDLPFVCQLNLPEAALHVYRESFNQAWELAGNSEDRFATAQNHAWQSVRETFERERATGRWVAKSIPLAGRRPQRRPAAAAAASALK
jgi:cation transport regulator ChaB